MEIKLKICKLAGSLTAIFSAGTLLAACQASETVTVAAGPGGSAVIVEECDAVTCCSSEAAQDAKSCMQPAGVCDTKTAKTDQKADHKTAPVVEVARTHSCPLAQFEAQASALAATLAHAFKDGDAKAFIAALPENMRKEFDEKKFLEAHKMLTDAMGEVVSADFVTDLKHPLLSIRLWKIGFKKITEDSGEIIQQVLFQVSIGEVDKKAQVVSFGFI